MIAGLHTQFVSKVLSGSSTVSALDSRNIAIICLAVVCAVAPLDISQMLFSLIGAAIYAVLSNAQKPGQKRVMPIERGEHVRRDPITSHPHGSRGQGSSPITRPMAGGPQRRNSPPASPQDLSTRLQRHAAHQSVARPPSPQHQALEGGRSLTCQPIVPLTFTSSGWEDEVAELVSQISPTPESERIVQQMAATVQRTLRKTIPDVEVAAFLSTDLLRGTAFGVAVPEVDVVATVSLEALASRMVVAGQHDEEADLRKVQKSVIRACTDKLVAANGFKFRRSAFRGREPKVTLLAPMPLGHAREAVPVDFSVNGTTPIHNAAIRTFCSQVDPRAAELILLVRRWAKDRGVCHEAKGHLSPYAWCILTVFFLQVGTRGEAETDADSEKACLPALDTASVLAAASPAACPMPPTLADRKNATASVAGLFKDFVRFYATIFDWEKELVAVRSGHRAARSADASAHVVPGPSIEDPFEPEHNLADGTTDATVARLHEELHRAHDLCTRGSSLEKLLELWAPPTLGERDADVTPPESPPKSPTTPATPRVMPTLLATEVSWRSAPSSEAKKSFSRSVARAAPWA